MVVWEAFIGDTPRGDRYDRRGRRGPRPLADQNRRVRAGDLDDMTAEQVERLDEQIREFEGDDGSGRPY